MTDPIKEDLAKIDVAFLFLIDDIFHDRGPVEECVAMIEGIYRPFMRPVEGLGYTRAEILTEVCLRCMGAVR